MDSRPRDDFIQPEPAAADHAGRAPREASEGEQAMLAAPGEAAGDAVLAAPGEAGLGIAAAMVPDDMLEDLERELASLLTPDLDAMDLDEPDAVAPSSDAGHADFPEGDDASVPVAEATDDAVVGTIVVSPPVWTDEPVASDVASTAGATAAADTGGPAGPEEFDPALDALASDMLDAGFMAASDAAPQSEEQDAVLVETVAVTALETEDGPTASGTQAPSDGTQAASPVAASAAEVPTLDAANADSPSAEPETTGQALPEAATPESLPLEATVSTPPSTLSETADDVTPADDVQATGPAAAEDMPARMAAGSMPGEAEPALPPEASGIAAEPAQGDVRAAGDSLAGEFLPAEPEPAEPEPAEPMTFEQALAAQDIQAIGFETAVRGAADRAGARFLFQMPVHTVPGCQRVAAVNLAGGDAPATLLILLLADGRSFRMEDARGSDNPFAGMAVSYGGLLAHLKSLPTRAAA